MAITNKIRAAINGLELAPDLTAALIDDVDDIDEAIDKLQGRIDHLEYTSVDEDEIEREVQQTTHAKLATELEPLFGALYRGDLEAARGVLGQLPPLLDSGDPILIALQRAKARPFLHLASAA